MSTFTLLASATHKSLLCGSGVRMSQKGRGESTTSQKKGRTAAPLPKGRGRGSTSKVGKNRTTQEEERRTASPNRRWEDVTTTPKKEVGNHTRPSCSKSWRSGKQRHWGEVKG